MFQTFHLINYHKSNSGQTFVGGKLLGIIHVQNPDPFLLLIPWFM